MVLSDTNILEEVYNEPSLVRLNVDEDDIMYQSGMRSRLCKMLYRMVFKRNTIGIAFSYTLSNVQPFVQTLTISQGIGDISTIELCITVLVQV